MSTDGVNPSPAGEIPLDGISLEPALIAVADAVAESVGAEALDPGLTPEEIADAATTHDPSSLLLAALPPDQTRAAVLEALAAGGRSVRELPLEVCAGYRLAGTNPSGTTGLTLAAEAEGTPLGVPALAVAGPAEAVEALDIPSIVGLRADPELAAFLSTDIAWEARARAAESELLAVRRDNALTRQALRETRRRLVKRSPRHLVRDLGSRLLARARRAGGAG